MCVYLVGSLTCNFAKNPIAQTYKETWEILETIYLLGNK